jgi:hypothetical protein
MLQRRARTVMDETLVPRLLDKAAIDQAYPLVRNIAAGITLERWNRFARPQVAWHSPNWPHGLMTIQNAAGYILGLFHFEVRDDLHERRILCIDNIIVPNLPGRDRIWESIAGAVEHLAQKSGCQAIRAELTDELNPTDRDREWVAASLEEYGYSRDGVLGFKRLCAGPGANGGPKPDAT